MSVPVFYPVVLNATALLVQIQNSVITVQVTSPRHNRRTLVIDDSCIGDDGIVEIRVGKNDNDYLCNSLHIGRGNEEDTGYDQYLSFGDGDTPFILYCLLDAVIKVYPKITGVAFKYADGSPCYDDHDHYRLDYLGPYIEVSPVKASGEIDEETAGISLFRPMCLGISNNELCAGIGLTN